MKNERNSSFEILRILAMLLIIGHHFVWYSGILNLDAIGCRNTLPAQVLYLGGPLGVNVFFMLSGYFYGNKFKTAKLVKLDLTVLFYSVCGFLLSAFWLHRPYQGKDIVKAALPLSTSVYWFLTVYVIVYMTSPVLNAVIEKLNKKQFIIIGTFVLFFVSIFPTVAFPMKLTHFNTMMMRGFLCYFLGAYLKKFPIRFLDHPISSLACFLGSYVFMGIVSILGKIHSSIETWNFAKTVLCDVHTSVPMLFCAMSAVMLAKSLPIGSVRYINLLSSTTLGVYVIHDNPYIRSYIWNDLLKTNALSNSDHYVLYALRGILMVFLACAAVEMLRELVIESFLDRWFDRVKLFQKADAIINISD